MDSSDTYSRRSLLRTGTGAAVGLAAAGATGTTAAQADAYGGYLEDEGTWGGETVDATGISEVTIEVGASGNGGNLAFDPAAIVVDPGTKVVWEWTGEGGSHNVVSEDDAFESELNGEAGFTFEQTFEEEGVEQYFCSPHRASGMKGVVAVGEGNAEGSLVPFGPQPDYGGYLEDVSNYDGVTVDRRGEEEVVVEVGAGSSGLLFGPPAVHVDNGATVVWEWTGQGGGHNVVSEDDAFDSGDPVGEAGTTFDHTFEEDGIYNYFCNPHKATGMKGSIVVGEEFPTLTGSVLNTSAVWAGAAVFGTVALIGVAAYRELFEDEELPA